mgnify:CR=1 FL=1
MRIFIILLIFIGSNLASCQNQMEWNGHKVEPVNVSVSEVKLDGENVLRVERDLEALPFDPDNIFKTVDEPTFAKITDQNFANGTIEVKVKSKLLKDAPEFARGFMGLAFRINDDNSRFESIYLRPTNARSDDQLRRNHSIQYYSYPNYKFNRLREEAPGKYESYADMGLDEWIPMKIIVKDSTAKLFLNNNPRPSLIVNDLKNGEGEPGSVGLWVEIGTEGYFKDLKITPEN